MRQVFDNLLTNALRHTAPGGTIAIEATRAAGGVQFTVANTGNLPPEQIEHIFDRFWRADEARQRDAAAVAVWDWRSHANLCYYITEQFMPRHKTA